MFLNNISDKNMLSTKDKILLSALEMFSNKGFNETTISEISKGAGVGEATIYEYFQNKEDLLFKIPEKFCREAMPLLNEHLQGIKGALNKIRKFIWFHLFFFQKNKSYANIMLLILRQNRKFLETESYEKIREYTRVIIQIVEEGKKEGSIKFDIDANLVRNMIMGTVEHLETRWLLINKLKDTDITLFADEISDLIIRAIEDNRIVEPIKEMQSS
jgi:AcrR family transcriptional regulator